MTVLEFAKGIETKLTRFVVKNNEVEPMDEEGWWDAFEYAIREGLLED